MYTTLGITKLFVNWIIFTVFGSFVCPQNSGDTVIFLCTFFCIFFRALLLFSQGLQLYTGGHLIPNLRSWILYQYLPCSSQVTVNFFTLLVSGGGSILTADISYVFKQIVLENICGVQVFVCLFVFM